LHRNDRLHDLPFNKLYCVYIAPNEEMVREHARLGGFPANHISPVKTLIDPTTPEDNSG
jgi:hypothetical protein